MWSCAAFHSGTLQKVALKVIQLKEIFFPEITFSAVIAYQGNIIKLVALVSLINNRKRFLFGNYNNYT